MAIQQRLLCTLALTACGLALSATACSKPSRSAVSSSPVPVTSFSTAGSSSPEAAVLDAYQKMWSTYAKATGSANYLSPDLSRYATAGARDLLVRALYNYKKEGVVTRGAPVNHPTVARLATTEKPPQATVRDCMDSSQWRRYDRNGKLIDTTPPRPRLVRAELASYDGSWKTTLLVVNKGGTC